jgi:tripartite ATP-independent transporter DctM subunit
MNEVVVGIVALFALLCIFATGIPLAFAMALVGFGGFVLLNDFGIALGLLSNDFFDSLANYGLTAVPLFVLMGQIALNSSIAKGLYNAAHKFLGHIPGGLATATVVGATVFKSICGSMIATSATFASIAIPEMDRYHYKKELSTGIVASVGTLGNLLPPSVILILLGLMTEQSIGKLFMAGIFPGLILALFFVFVIFGWCRLNPSIGPKSERYSWSERRDSLPAVMWPVIIFVVLVGGLMYGIFTPTEAGSIGTFAVLVLCILRRDIQFKSFIKAVNEALRTSCMVLMLVASSAILSHFIAITDLPQVAADWVVGLKMHRVLAMMMIFLVYLVGGSVIDDLAFLILATPIFFPIMVKLGYDPIWACIMIALINCLGVVLPPLAVTVFVVKQITKTPIGTIYRGVYPFLISMVLCIILLFIFPQIATYLPSVLMK